MRHKVIVKKMLVALGKSLYQTLGTMFLVVLSLAVLFWPLFFLPKYDTAGLFIATAVWIIFVSLMFGYMSENFK